MFNINYLIVTIARARVCVCVCVCVLEFSLLVSESIIFFNKF